MNSISTSGTSETAASSATPYTFGAGTAVPSSAATIRASRATSCAEASRFPNGGRRSTHLRPAASRTRKVRLDWPSPILSKLIAAANSTPSAPTHPGTAAGSSPTICCTSDTDRAAAPERQRVAEQLPAVDHHGLAGDPTRPVRDEEGDGRRDVGGLADPRQRSGRGHGLLVLLPQRLGQLGPDAPRRDRIDPNPGRKLP